MPPPSTGGADWLELAVEVAGIDAETVADAFRQHCSGGVAIEPAARREGDVYVVDGDGPALVKGYLPPGEEARRVRRNLRIALRFAPLESAPRWRRARRLPEADWRDAWKRYFKPKRVGRGLVVKPSWATYNLAAGDTVIEIDPGMAFGTGQHPTTAMCLRALEERLRRGDAVLDLGCGTGILAVAAAKLGARRVLALDVDPQAVKATRENAAANGVADIVEPCEGTLPEGTLPEGARAETGARPGGERFGVVVANIGALTIERLAGALAGATAEGGSVIVSGFLEDAVDALTAALEGAGLRIAKVEADGVWRAIVAERAGRA